MAIERARPVAICSSNASLALFRRAGWEGQAPAAAGDLHADLFVQRGAHSYVVEVKSAPEGRRDACSAPRSGDPARPSIRRTQPELSAPSPSSAPSASARPLCANLNQFVQEYAPDAAVGLVDLEASVVS